MMFCSVKVSFVMFMSLLKKETALKPTVRIKNNLPEAGTRWPSTKKAKFVLSTIWPPEDVASFPFLEKVKMI